MVEEAPPATGTDAGPAPGAGAGPTQGGPTQGGPEPQVFGNREAAGAAAGAAAQDAADEFQRRMAQEAAKEGMRQAGDAAKTGFREVKAYITENPPSLKICCFVTGLMIMAFSIAGVFLAGGLDPVQYVHTVYNVCFGLMICICDGKESWGKALCNVQELLFKYCFALATKTGRALFYFYVGSTTILLLPDGFIWPFIYVVMGGVLCLLAVTMLFLEWCGQYCGCKESYRDMESNPRANQ